MRPKGTVARPSTLTDPGGHVLVPGAVGGPTEVLIPGSSFLIQIVTDPSTAAIRGVVVPLGSPPQTISL